MVKMHFLQKVLKNDLVSEKKLLHIFQLIGGLGWSRPKSGKFHFFIFIHWKGSKIFF